MAYLSRHGAWQPVVWFVSIGCAALIPVVWLLLPEHPGDIGTERFGATADSPPPKPPRGAPSVGLAFTALRTASRSPMFWLLYGTFFVCGLTTNGLVGTHLIAYCGDHGIPPVQAAGLLSLMGLFDLFGTTGSGWLTDRHDPRKLLFVYYGLRGLSLMALPFLDFGPGSLTTFAIFYGLDWIATVPPTVKLATQTFGERDAPIIFGWVFVGHQLGASVAAFGAGFVRTITGSYDPAFFVAGAFGVAAALVLIGWRGGRTPALATA
jgi:predicted MFS family arabinose efflux permease